MSKAWGKSGFCGELGSVHGTHLADEILDDLFHAPVYPQLFDTIRDELLGIFNQRASLPLPVVVPRGALARSGKRLDRGEALNTVLCAESFIRRDITVDRVERDQRGERLSRGGVLWPEVLAMPTPRRDKRDHLGLVVVPVV
jgi:hypothetical protein